MQHCVGVVSNQFAQENNNTKKKKRRYKTMTYKDTSVTHFSHRGEESNSFRKLLCGMIKAIQPCGPLFNAQLSIQLSKGIIRVARGRQGS